MNDLVKITEPKEINQSYQLDNHSRAYMLADHNDWKAFIYFNQTISNKSYWMVFEEIKKTTRID